MDFQNENIIYAYNFEPEYSDQEMLENQRRIEEYEEKDSQLSVEEFCSCGNCILMPTSEENVCCKGSCLTVGNMEDHECITEIAAFPTIVLDTTVLEVAHIQMMTYKGSRARAPDQLNNTQYRLSAYRQFVCLMMKGERLGKSNRVIIPACVVGAIRKSFPSPTYCGFKTALESVQELFN